MINQIFNCDCLKGMRRIPDKSIDMVCADLPYGTTRNRWDCIIDLTLLWEQYKRIIKDNGAIVLTAQTPFDKVLGASNIKMLKCEWIWKKESGTGFLNAKKYPLKNHENILVFCKGVPNYNPQMRLGFKSYESIKGHHGTNYGSDKGAVTISDGSRYPLTIIEFSRDKDKTHPTQKPVALFEYLIKTYTNEGDLVLDNCAGSFTTAVACDNLKRNWICMEKEKEYCEKGLTRINQNREQLELPTLEKIYEL